MSVIRYLFVSTSLGLLKPLSILLFTCAIVTGCGGGGSSSPGSVPTSPAPDQNPTPDLDSH
ncbi:MAG: hypothetical protein L7S71_02050, partial [Pseudomonadales bacterium]|nr:hypothetical protein [Pseudomonadales bacterium]